MDLMAENENFEFYFIDDCNNGISHFHASQAEMDPHGPLRKRLELFISQSVQLCHAPVVVNLTVPRFCEARAGRRGGRGTMPDNFETCGHVRIRTLATWPASGGDAYR